MKEAAKTVFTIAIAIVVAYLLIEGGNKVVDMLNAKALAAKTNSAAAEEEEPAA